MVDPHLSLPPSVPISLHSFSTHPHVEPSVTTPVTAVDDDDAAVPDVPFYAHNDDDESSSVGINSMKDIPSFPSPSDDDLYDQILSSAAVKHTIKGGDSNKNTIIPSQSSITIDNDTIMTFDDTLSGADNDDSSNAANINTNGAIDDGTTPTIFLDKNDITFDPGSTIIDTNLMAEDTLHPSTIVSDGILFVHKDNTLASSTTHPPHPYNHPSLAAAIDDAGSTTLHMIHESAPASSHHHISNVSADNEDNDDDNHEIMEVQFMQQAKHVLTLIWSCSGSIIKSIIAKHSTNTAADVSAIAVESAWAARSLLCDA